MGGQHCQNDGGTHIQGVLEERLKANMVTCESGTIREEKRTVELPQETPTQTQQSDPDLKKLHHGGESLDQLGEHCAKVYDTSYSTRKEMESYACYETDDEFLFSRGTLQKASQEGVSVQLPYRGRSSLLQGIYTNRM